MRLTQGVILGMFWVGVVHGYGLKCSQLIDGEALYELEFLQHPVAYNHTFTKDNTQYLLQYNFCKYISVSCEDKASFASLFFQRDSRDQCIRLTSDSQMTNYGFSLLDGDFKKGLSYRLQGGSQYSYSTKYEMNYHILCDRNEETFRLTGVEWHDQVVTVTGRSQYGCPVVQVSSLMAWVVKYRYLFAILLLMASTMVCFNGFRLLIPVLFFFGYMTGFLLVMLIFGEFILSQHVNQLLLFICILVAIVIGSVVGYVFIKLPRIAYTGVGIWLGMVASFMLNKLLLHDLQMGFNNMLLYLTLMALVPLMGYLSYRHWEQLAIFNTSLVGAYGMTRALSVYLGHFPDEVGSLSSTSPDYTYCLLYLGLIGLLTVGGVVVQVLRQRQALQDKELEEGLVVELNSYSQL